MEIRWQITKFAAAGFLVASVIAQYPTGAKADNGDKKERKQQQKEERQAQQNSPQSNQNNRGNQDNSQQQQKQQQQQQRQIQQQQQQETKQRQQDLQRQQQQDRQRQQQLDKSSRQAQQNQQQQQKHLQQSTNDRQPQIIQHSNSQNSSDTGSHSNKHQRIRIDDSQPNDSGLSQKQQNQRDKDLRQAQKQQEEASQKAQKQQEQLLKQQQNNAGKSSKHGNIVVPAKETPFVPSDLPGGLSKKGQKQQDQLLKKQQNQAEKALKNGSSPQAAKQTPFVPTGIPAGLSKKDQKQQQQDANKAQKQQEQLLKQQQKNLKNGNVPGQVGNNQLAPGAPGINPALTNKQERKLGKEAQQQEKQAQNAQKDLDKILKQQSKGGGQNFQNLKKLNNAQKAVLIGADVLPQNASKKQIKNFLSQSNANYVFNNVKIKNVNKTVNIVNNGVINQFKSGHIPDHYRPYGQFGRIGRPFLSPGAYQPYLLPPPAPIGPVPLNVGFHNWNYWDGRCYYDNDYAESVYRGCGHERVDGYDGIVVSGRYWSYGYGWISGCIDYGSRRMWVPGFMAPYTVQECRDIPIWMPPVFEDVWTGCCWERVQVDGGYFAPVHNVECHLVTRFTWVPGHWEYHY